MSFNKFKFIRGVEVVRHLKLDLWGKLLGIASNNSSRLFRQFYKRRRGRRPRHFVMRIDINEPKKPRKFLSMYGLGMVDKQKFRHYWGNISEEKFKRIFKSSFDSRVPKFDAFIRSMETTALAVAMRTGFFDSISHVKQLILHGHVYINDNVVTDYYYRLAPGDRISFSDSVKEKLKRRSFKLYLNYFSLPPSYLLVSYKIFAAIILYWPTSSTAYYPFKYDGMKLVNFYKA